MWNGAGYAHGFPDHVDHRLYTHNGNNPQQMAVRTHTGNGIPYTPYFRPENSTVAAKNNVEECGICPILTTVAAGIAVGTIVKATETHGIPYLTKTYNEHFPQGPEHDMAKPGGAPPHKEAVDSGHATSCSVM